MTTAGRHWEASANPAALNYRRYIALQHDREVYAEGVVDHYEALDDDHKLDPAWIETLTRIYVPARYLFHVLQITSLLCRAASPQRLHHQRGVLPGRRRTAALQWIAYRAKSLSLTHGTQLANSEATQRIWETDEVWQPARETLERLLLAYDWGEAFTALNLVVKPALDALFKEAFAELASDNGDGLTAALLQESARRCHPQPGLERRTSPLRAQRQPRQPSGHRRLGPKSGAPGEPAVDGLATALPDPDAALDQVAHSGRGIHRAVGGLTSTPNLECVHLQPCRRRSGRARPHTCVRTALG
ncbi:hypothetical protein H7I76_03895, partial [Mycolicibacterium vaccae]|nr:hypothetical protein [Mycolicibacterium vaccae]